MCRLAAYTGQNISLTKFLIEPEHSLYRQSWAPGEMDEAALNADGFGFGWYTDADRPYTYTNTLPVWSDGNLHGLGENLSGRIWLGNVRSATPGQPLSHDNTQPFSTGPWLFMHNGFIEGFRETVRRSFHEYLPPEIQAGISGNTDSEYLFALFRNALTGCDSTEFDIIFGRMFEDLYAILDSAKALLNIIVSDGRSIIAVRHACNGGRCPTLYWSDNQPGFPNGVIIASERLSTTGLWHSIREHSSLHVGPGNIVTQNDL